MPFAKFSFCLFFIFSGFFSTLGGKTFFTFFFLSFGFFLINSAISLISFFFFNSAFFFSTIFLLGAGGGGGVFLTFSFFITFLISFTSLTLVSPNLRDVLELIGVSSTISIGDSIGSLILKEGKP